MVHSAPVKAMVLPLAGANVESGHQDICICLSSQMPCNWLTTSEGLEGLWLLLPQPAAKTKKRPIITGKRSFIDSVYGFDSETAVIVADSSTFVGHIIISIVKFTCSIVGYQGDYIVL